MSMKLLPRLVLVVITVLLTLGMGTSFSQTDLNETLRQLEAQSREAELASRIRSLQFDADMARMRAQRAETDQLTDRLRADTERMRTEREAQDVAERAERAAARQEEIARAAATKAEEKASELQDEITLADVKTKNSFYLVGLAAVFVGFGVIVIKAKERGLPMKDNEKCGLAVIITSFLLVLLSLTLSDGWFYKLDLLGNLMSELKIRFLVDEDHYGKFLIDFPTKYLVLIFISMAAYGVTTYLGITPALWKKKIKDRQEFADPPNP